MERTGRLFHGVLRLDFDFHLAGRQLVLRLDLCPRNLKQIVLVGERPIFDVERKTTIQRKTDASTAPSTQARRRVRGKAVGRGGSG